jgi:5-methylcytosine-specific restriction endonuclease McrA
MRKNERHAAQLKGERHYFTGKPCANGHVSLRYTKCASCVACRAEKGLEYRKSSAWKTYVKNYLVNNKKILIARKKLWVARNKDKACAQVAKRKAAKLNRTPPWLTDAEFFEIDCIYQYAASLNSLGLRHEVDHIVPLQGAKVSGLHVPWNLQVLTLEDNRRKGNSYYE